MFRHVGLDLARQVREDAELLVREANDSIRGSSLAALAARVMGERIHLYGHLLGAICTGPDIGPIEATCNELELAFQRLCSATDLVESATHIRKLSWELSERLMALDVTGKTVE